METPLFLACAQLFPPAASAISKNGARKDSLAANFTGSEPPPPSLKIPAAATAAPHDLSSFSTVASPSSKSFFKREACWIQYDACLALLYGITAKQDFIPRPCSASQDDACPRISLQDFRVPGNRYGEPFLLRFIFVQAVIIPPLNSESSFLIASPTIWLQLSRPLSSAQGLDATHINACAIPFESLLSAAFQRLRFSASLFPFRASQQNPGFSLRPHPD